MAINYNKYIESTGTHWIGNSGHDENGKYHGGAAGDQTGGEAALRAWYSRPWTVVLRYPDPAVALLIAKLEIEMCLNDNVGYDQYQRYTYWDALVAANYSPSAIKTKCEQDCTAGTTANVKAAGHILGIRALADIDKTTRSGNMKARFVAAGFRALTASKYLSSPKYLLPGDVLLCENHHAAMNITYGSRVDKAAQAAPEPVSKPCKLGDRVLENGMTGEDVKELQLALIKLGYDCGKWGADGEFGDATELAVKAFQRDHGLDVDGEAGPLTLAALKKALAALHADVEAPEWVRIVGGSCYVREAPSVKGEKLGVAAEGSRLPWGGRASADGWLPVVYKDRTGWVSGKYGRLV